MGHSVACARAKGKMTQFSMLLLGFVVYDGVCNSAWSPAEVCAVPTAARRRRRCGVAPLMDIPSATRVVSTISCTG